MNLEDLLTKLQAERKVWQDRAKEEFALADKAFEDLEVQLKHLRQASYDQGVAWGLYLASTLILQEQLEHQNAPQSSGKAVSSDSLIAATNKPHLSQNAP